MNFAASFQLQVKTFNFLKILVLYYTYPKILLLWGVVLSQSTFHLVPYLIGMYLLQFCAVCRQFLKATGFVLLVAQKRSFQELLGNRLQS